MFLEIKIFGAVLVRAVLAMGRFGIDPNSVTLVEHFGHHLKLIGPFEGRTDRCTDPQRDASQNSTRWPVVTGVG